MGTITLAGSRGYQDIGTIGQTVPQLAENVLSINAILDVGLRNTRDYQHGWIRVSDLIGLGLATLINGDQLTATVSSGSSSVNVTNSITGTGSGATPLQLSGDVGSPGNDYFYGTNGSGIKGFYALSSYSGTVTSVGLSDTSTTPIYTVGGTNPVTSNGTIDITLKTQPANDVFAGPTTGSAAQPAFRTLVAADLPSGTGTVTSVGLSDGSSTPIYTISGSPVTTSGTLTKTLKTQTANTVFAGPTTGGAAQPAFRALVAADVPASTGNIGINAALGWIPTTSAANFSNYSILARIPQGALLNACNTWTFNCNVVSGSLAIGGCNVRTTAPGSSTYLSSTAVTWSGSATPTLAAGNTSCDPISVVIDGTKDIYIEFYFTTGAPNTTVALGQATAAATSLPTMAAYYLAGNHIGGSSTFLTIAQIGSNQYLVNSCVKVS